MLFVIIFGGILGLFWTFLPFAILSRQKQIHKSLMHSGDTLAAIHEILAKSTIRDYDKQLTKTRD
ncbi:MAG: hypothetical protein ACE5FH_13415, partial [Candidatus Zixiibacteriota bacterium]